MAIHRPFILVLCILVCTANFLHAVNSANCRSSNDCNRQFISDDCGNGCSADGCSLDTPVSTFLRPRTITTDLTYRNDSTFYQKYHDGCCNFFTYDSAFIYQKNRRAACQGAGFFGTLPFTISEQGGNMNALNVGLGSRQPEGFESTFFFRPKREIFAWLNQFIFNLDCCLTGLWSDIAFAVVKAHNTLCIHDQISIPGEINGVTNAQQAFRKLEVFGQQKHLGLDDIEVRLGWDYLYCDLDHVGFYLLGSIPTGKRFNNRRWLQPIVGSQNGGLGAGFTADNTLWDDECAQTAFLVMTEFKYQFKFPSHDLRMFDLKNGQLSRFLLVAREPFPLRFAPVSATTILGQCVRIEPRSTFDWWLAFHYQWCTWGFEVAYNLFYRDEEHLKPGCVNLGDFGIFDMTRCGNLTSHSTALITDDFGVGTPDATFTRLTPADINFCSGRALKALSNKFSGSVSYNNIWCDCYPVNFALALSYELPSRKHRSATLENWGVFGRFTISV